MGFSKLKGLIYGITCVTESLLFSKKIACFKNLKNLHSNMPGNTFTMLNITVRNEVTSRFRVVLVYVSKEIVKF